MFLKNYTRMKVNIQKNNQLRLLQGAGKGLKLPILEAREESHHTHLWKMFKRQVILLWVYLCTSRTAAFKLNEQRATQYLHFPWGLACALCTLLLESPDRAMATSGGRLVNPCPKQDHLPSVTSIRFKYFQGWRFHNIFVPVFDRLCLHQRSFFSVEFPIFQFVLSASSLFTGRHWEKVVPIFTALSQISMHIEEFPPPGWTVPSLSVYPHTSDAWVP